MLHTLSYLAVYNFAWTAFMGSNEKVYKTTWSIAYKIYFMLIFNYSVPDTDVTIHLLWSNILMGNAQTHGIGIMMLQRTSESIIYHRTFSVCFIFLLSLSQCFSPSTDFCVAHLSRSFLNSMWLHWKLITTLSCAIIRNHVTLPCFYK